MSVRGDAGYTTWAGGEKEGRRKIGLTCLSLHFFSLQEGEERTNWQLSLREALVGHDDGPFPSSKERPTRRLPWLALVAEEHF